MGIREEFEKLTEIAEILKGGQYKFISNECGYYSDVEGVSTEAIDLAWYAFQAQQKKIDEIVKLVHDHTPDYWLDNMIQELLK